MFVSGVGEGANLRLGGLTLSPFELERIRFP